jgi:hypothetical protein
VARSASTEKLLTFSCGHPEVSTGGSIGTAGWPASLRCAIVTDAFAIAITVRKDAKKTLRQMRDRAIELFCIHVLQLSSAALLRVMGQCRNQIELADILKDASYGLEIASEMVPLELSAMTFL